MRPGDGGNELAEAYWNVSQAATGRYLRRHTSEWRVNFAYWTLLAVSVSWLLINTVSFDSLGRTLITTFAGVLLGVFLHWCKRLHERNHHDIQMALFWQNKYLMQSGMPEDELSTAELNIIYPEWTMIGDEAPEAVASRSEIIGLGQVEEQKTWPSREVWNWSMSMQIAISVILTFAIIVATWAPLNYTKANPDTDDQAKGNSPAASSAD